MDYIKKEVKSFGYAFSGIKVLFLYCTHAKIHLVAAFAAIAAGIYLKISFTEWAIITLTIGAVLAAEAINSAIEYLADKVSEDIHPLIKNAKDVAAGAVLILAITSVVVAAFIFGPKLF